MSEYGEPWSVKNTEYPGGEVLETIFNAKGDPVLGDRLFGYCYKHYTREMLERVAVLMNLCAGIPTEDLVSGKARVIPSSHTEDARKFAAQIDALPDDKLKALIKKYIADLK